MESVALYSFQTTEKDELPFQKGDTLKVWGTGWVTSHGEVRWHCLGDRAGTWHGVTLALSLHPILLPLWGFLWGMRSHPGGFLGVEQHRQQRWVLATSPERSQLGQARGLPKPSVPPATLCSSSPGLERVFPAPQGHWGPQEPGSRERAPKHPPSDVTWECQKLQGGSNHPQGTVAL